MPRRPLTVRARSATRSSPPRRRCAPARPRGTTARHLQVASAATWWKAPTTFAPAPMGQLGSRLRERQPVRPGRVERERVHAADDRLAVEERREVATSSTYHGTAKDDLGTRGSIRRSLHPFWQRAQRSRRPSRWHAERDPDDGVAREGEAVRESAALGHRRRRWCESWCPSGQAVFRSRTHRLTQHGTQFGCRAIMTSDREIRRALRPSCGKTLDHDEAVALASARGDDLVRLSAIATRRSVTRRWSPRAAPCGHVLHKVFIPVTRLCRDRWLRHLRDHARRIDSCRRPDPGDRGPGAAQGCEELLAAEQPPRGPLATAREGLHEHGYDDTLSYVRAMAIRVLEETGLLPHLNPGVMSWAEARRWCVGRAVDGHDARDDGDAPCGRRPGGPPTPRTRTPRCACGCWRTPPASRSRPASSSGSARPCRSRVTPSSRCAASPGRTGRSRR